MQRKIFTDCVDIVGSACKQYDGEKNYISTGAVDVNYIVPSEVEQFDYINRPSRANLEVNKGDILFAKMQGTKKTLLINELLAQNVYSTGFCAVRPKNGILTERCLYHLVSSETFLLQKDKNCSGATQKAITNAGLGKIMIKVPEYNSQEILADELDKLAKIIERRKSQLEKMDELIKARFVELFGDPVEHLDRGETVSLEKIADRITVGFVGEASNEYVDEGVPYLRTQNVRVNHIDLSGLIYVNEAFHNKNQKSIIHPGDIVISRVGVNRGMAAVIPNSINEANIANCLIVGQTNEINSFYLAFYMNMSYGKRPQFGASVGSAQGVVNTSILKKWEVYVPDRVLQDEFNLFMEQVDKSKVAVQKSLDETQKLFDSLMQEYFG